MSKKHYTPNEMRSNVKNPNNSAHVADQANRAQQSGGIGQASPSVNGTESEGESVRVPARES